MKYLTIIWLALSPITLLSQSPSEIISTAQQYEQAGDIDQAIGTYLQLNDHRSADIYYNIGRLYHEKGQNAMAVLYYERALKTHPHHSASEHNLTILREEVEIDIIPVPEMFLIRWWKAIAALCSPGVWLVLTIMVALLWCVAMYLWWFSKEEQRKKMAFIASIGLPLLLMIMYALGSSAQHERVRSDYAIILDDDYDMHEGADKRSPVVKDINAGTKVQILDRIDDWIKVTTADTESGWIKADEAESI